MSSSKAVKAKHDELLFPCVANYYQEPVVITHAEGTRVHDIEGREYLDFFGGILTVSLGHCQPEIVQAVSEQIRKLGHVSTLYPTENMLRVAELLRDLSPGKLTKSFFTNSGTEADETAIMLAKLHTGQSEIIALRHGYHGRSLLNTNLTAHHQYRLMGSQVPGIKHAPAPYCYRCPFGREYPSCEVACASDLEELILTETCGKPAAFLAEPILGVGGFITPPAEYFKIAVEIVRKYGGVFICDEVQTGFGRTGGTWFGIEHWEVEPDIMTMAKGMANGMPVGATIATAEIADSWKGGSISTFGGNPVSMAATEATLGVMQREDIPARAARLGAKLSEHLHGLAERYAFVGEVRGMGLMQAMELVVDRGTKEPATKLADQIMEGGKKHGLLLGKGGLYGNTLRLAPPMLISESELDEALSRLDKAFAEASP